MTLIKELIDIPDRVQRGDFVLKLTEGVTDADVTLVVRDLRANVRIVEPKQ